MTMFIKICGMTSADAVAAAVAAGADAVGFVFAESPRRVSPIRACELAARLPASVERVAVTRHPSAALCREIFDVFSPDTLQTDAEDLAMIRLPAGCAALPVFRNSLAPRDISPQTRLLFEGLDSGTGKIADWQAARELAKRARLILAGGLDAVNVEEAILAVRPFGVDVSSGVESSPGIKDPGKIEAFVARVRTAEKRL
jgi:phosphoribosylanthranilate isomerase